MYNIAILIGVSKVYSNSRCWSRARYDDFLKIHRFGQGRKNWSNYFGLLSDEYRDTTRASSSLYFFHSLKVTSFMGKPLRTAG